MQKSDGCLLILISHRMPPAARESPATIAEYARAWKAQKNNKNTEQIPKKDAVNPQKKAKM